MKFVNFIDDVLLFMFFIGVINDIINDFADHDLRIACFTFCHKPLPGHFPNPLLPNFPSISTISL